MREKTAINVEVYVRDRTEILEVISDANIRVPGGVRIGHAQRGCWSSGKGEFSRRRSAGVEVTKASRVQLAARADGIRIVTASRLTCFVDMSYEGTVRAAIQPWTLIDIFGVNADPECSSALTGTRSGGRDDKLGASVAHCEARGTVR